LHIVDAMLDFQGRLLQRAMEICGGRPRLCARLGVSDQQLKTWIAGEARIPESVFLAASDIVLEDDVARAEQDRRSMPRKSADGVLPIP
jgi:hypothetical protein